MERFIRHMLSFQTICMMESQKLKTGERYYDDLKFIASGDNVCASADYQKNRGKILDTGISLYEYMESILHMENP